MKKKETIRRFVVNERASCDSHTKLSGIVPHIEKGVTFTQKKENMV